MSAEGKNQSAEAIAVLVAPMGAYSGEARWAAATMLRQQAAEIERLRVELAAAKDDIVMLIARETEACNGH